MQSHVVASGLDPVDLLGTEEEDAAARLHDQAVRVAVTLPLAPQIFEEGEESCVDRLPRLPHVASGAGESLLESRFVEGLQQEVQRMDLECLEGVIVVRGDEHDGGRPSAVRCRRGRIAALERFDDIEAIDFGHLDVEEDEIGILVVDGAECFGSVGAFGDDFDVVVFGEESAHALARELFVVNDRDADLVGIGNQSAAVRSRE